MDSVLLVGKGPPEVGGIPTFLTTLLDSDLAKRYDLRLLSLGREQPAPGGRWSARNTIRTAQDAVALWRASGTADVVHLHSAFAPTTTVLRLGLLARIAALRGCRVIVQVHGGRIERWLRTRARSQLVRSALAPAEHVVAVSPRGAAVLAGVLGARRVVHIPNGVDERRFRPGSANPRPRVLFAGALQRRKGVLDLFEASRLLQSRGVEHELVLAGEGAEEHLRKAAPAWARFVGLVPQDQMPDILRLVDVLCLPSWWEAMPMSVLEAMAASLPVVASDVGAVGSMVVDGVTGRVVPPQAPTALADALEELLRDPGLRDRYGRSGRSRLERYFSISVTVMSLERVYGHSVEAVPAR